MNTAEKGDILLVLVSLFILAVVGILIFRVPENKISLLGATESKSGELTYIFADNQGNSVERRHGYL
jgi:hypothetical protein